MTATPPLRLYYAFARWLGPSATRLLLRRRAARGKEDVERLSERFGVAGVARPEGPLAWLHGASVGESVSLLPLIDALRAARPDLLLLVTSGTVTSARLMAKRLPEGVIHQFAPVDTFEAVGRFLDHWRPGFLGLVESEIWPVMLSETRKRGARTALLSARLSERSAKGWRRAPRTIAALLGQLDVILAQNETVAARLRDVGAPAERLAVAGSLKQAAAPLPVDEGVLAAWRDRLGDRPLWLAASTHAGEESAALAAHRALRARAPHALTVIAPRHPERCDAVAEEIRVSGARLARLSRGETVDAETDVYLVDALGELGLWFRLAPVVFVGGSLEPIGGHNPLEPARLGAAVLIGPHVESVTDETERLRQGGAATLVADADALGAALAEAFGDDARPTEAILEMGRRGAALTASDAGALDRIMAAIAPLLPAPPQAEIGETREAKNARA